MYAFRFNGVVSQQFVLLLEFFLVGQVRHILQFRELSGDIGEYEQGRVFWVAGNQVYTFVCQIYAVQLLVDDEIQRISHLMHTLVVLLHIDFLCLEHTGLDALLTQELNQRFIFRQCLMAAIQSEESLFHIFLVTGCDQLLGLRQIFGSQYLLRFYQTFNQRTELFE